MKAVLLRVHIEFGSEDDSALETEGPVICKEVSCSDGECQSGREHRLVVVAEITETQSCRDGEFELSLHRDIGCLHEKGNLGKELLIRASVELIADFSSDGEYGIDEDLVVDGAVSSDIEMRAFIAPP